MKIAEAEKAIEQGDRAAAIVQRFMADLMRRYVDMAARAARAAVGGRSESGMAGRGNGSEVAGAPRSLILADAALRYGPLSRFGGIAAGRGAGAEPNVDRGRPVQIAVMGPTQAGKSTIVNLVLGCEAAGVSPLAGHTVHPQGFWLKAGESGRDDAREASAANPDLAWLAEIFPGSAREDRDKLSRERLAAYSVSRVLSGAEEAESLPACVIWDTPDFDSLAAHSYERNLLEAAALADVYVTVLSKEKYSDLSAWQMMRLLEPLGRPMVICLNKMTPDAAEAITASLQQRLGEFAPAWKNLEIVRVPYAEGAADHCERAALPAMTEAARELRGRVAEMASTVARGDEGVVKLVRMNWDEWLAPVRGEHAAAAQWCNIVDEGLLGLLEAYRRDYLDHPQRYDSFRRATAELLQLLEIPGIGGVLGGVRQVVSWPGRKLWAMGRGWMVGKGGVVGPRVSSEEAVLYDTIDELLMRLQRDAARHSDPENEGAAVWQAISRRLSGQQIEFRRRFREAAGMHHGMMAQEIQQAAGKLYETLQKHPAMLAGLRTARLSADVASIALAIKMGGASMHDVIFAPAMFGLTSMLTEGALGSYVRGVADELKLRQFEHVRGRLVDNVFRSELYSVGRELADDGLFGMAEERVAEAQAALAAWGGPV